MLANVKWVSKSEKVYLWEVSFGIADEQASLSTATISNHDELLGKDGRLGESGANGITARRGSHVAVDGAVADTFVRRATRGFAEGLSMRKRVYGSNGGSGGSNRGSSGSNRGSGGSFAAQVVIVGVAVHGAGARCGYDRRRHVCERWLWRVTGVDCL
jgi:hypothetical protein